MELGDSIFERLSHFLGKPTIVHGIPVYSPTIDSIGDIGEIQYNVYLTLATFDKESILKLMFGLSSDEYSELENEDSYEVLTSIPVIANELINALSFFIKDQVQHDQLSNSYLVHDKTFINSNNYLELVKTIKEQNGVSESKKSIKFNSEISKQKYERLLELRKNSKKKNDDQSLTLKDMLSILCHAEGNGINIFNVGELTIYQVYEHFERLNVREQHKRLLRIWANGYLGKDEKLPEWMVKTKL